ncbi:hypothetical protein P152DRAFT_435397, partial [Eremomyces bilateralis CBS 781.70]
MSLSLFIAHSGEQLRADPVSIGSLDALKRWIHEATRIPGEDQILLTSRGKHVKLQTLLTEKELFIYDRELFTHPKQAAQNVPESPAPEPYIPTDPPDTLANQTNLKSWQTLFASRRDWALELTRDCKSMAQTAERHFTQQSIVERGLHIATGNHEPHVRGLERKCQEAREWFKDVSKEHRENVDTWEADVDKLTQIGAVEDFRYYLSAAPSPVASKPSKKSSNATTPLASFVDVDATQKAATATKTATDEFAGRISDLGSRIAAVASEYDGLMERLNQLHGRSTSGDIGEPGKLLEEIEVIARKVTTDHDHVMALPPNPKSVAQVSKMALLHTRNHLPTIAEYAAEMGDVVRRAVHQKNTAVRSMLEHMKLIASLEGRIDSLKKEFSGLELSPDIMTDFDTLALVGKLPLLYGNLTIETVRCREWTEKMKRDTEALAEDLAGYKEEENRRRKKWVRGMGEVLRTGSLERKVLGVEVNLQGGDESWPAVTREDVEAYIYTLSELGGFDSTVSTLTQSFKDLDKPTRSQIKRAKAFKNGSVHEGLGKGSLMLRGEDDNRVLRVVNTRLEDELRGQKSRIRKLEDLLHRQSHINRLGSPGSAVTFHGGGLNSPSFDAPPTPTTTAQPARHELKSPSPRQHDEHSRRSSISSRRFSANQPAEDKAALVRKVLALENELTTVKAAHEVLERESAGRTASAAQERRASEEKVSEVQRLMAEANSTKEDLMKNMDAQAKEWQSERKHLIDEIRKLKEDYEEDVDKLMASREQERVTLEEKVDNTRMEGEMITSELEVQLKKVEEKAEANHAVVDKLKDLVQFILRSLSQNDVEVPIGDEELIVATRDIVDDVLKTLVEKSTRIADQLQDAQMNTARVAALESDAATLREEADTLMREKESLNAELQEMKTRFDQEQQELRDLAKMLEEKQSGDAEGDARIMRLMSELAEGKSHINTLDAKLSSTQRRYERLVESLRADGARLDARADRARQLTRKLFTSTERLNRLVETLGFTVGQPDEKGNLIIQRASKVSSSGVLADGSVVSTVSGSRNLSNPSVMKRTLDELSDNGALEWSSASAEEEEASKFANYLSAIEQFPLNAFCEALAKRQRDVEHTARKWQKESRTYRERAHRYQHESHEKIAYRSFKEGDLALFLPTRNQTRGGAWAAFNVGAPHYFLREQESHRLSGREWLVARIGKIEERVVDLSPTMEGGKPATGGRRRGTSVASMASELDDDNPFELGDGLRWYLLDALEEKPHPLGAPITPRAGTTTVASANVDARGTVGTSKKGNGEGEAARTLGRLDERAAGSTRSRRSSENSRRSVPPPGSSAGPKPLLPTENNGEGTAEGSAGTEQREGGDVTMKAPPRDTRGEEEIPAPSTPLKPPPTADRTAPAPTLTVSPPHATPDRGSARMFSPSGNRTGTRQPSTASPGRRNASASPTKK